MYDIQGFDVRSAMPAVAGGTFFCDKQMNLSKNLKATNPKKRDEPEKSKRSVRWMGCISIVNFHRMQLSYY